MPETLNDEVRMWFGMHEGVRLADIPGEYFFWLWEHPKGPKLHAKPGDPLHRYIVKNWKRISNDAPDYDPINQPPRDTRTATEAPKRACQICGEPEAKCPGHFSHAQSI